MASLLLKIAADEGAVEGRDSILAGGWEACMIRAVVSPIKRSTGGINLTYELSR